MGRKVIEVVNGRLKCTTCAKSKDEIEFSRSTRRKCGRASSCKVCEAAAFRARYKADPRRHKARAARWKRQHPERGKNEYLRSKEKIMHYMRVDREKRPDVWRARKAVNNAIREGKLQRLPCEVCGNPKTDGHHWSYEKEHWLDVKWLCRKHHLELHRGTDKEVGA